MESPKPLHFAHAGIELQGWLGGLRSRGGDEALARIELLPGALEQGKSWKWHRLLRPWVAHVAAAAGDLPLTTLLVGEDVSLQFAPLERQSAEQILRQWLEGWRAGLEAPLPVALKTAIAWLSSGGDGVEDEAKAEEAARKTYEGDYNHRGEVQGSASLARQYPDFAALVADGEFYAWSHDLYQSLLASGFAVLKDQQEDAA